MDIKYIEGIKENGIEYDFKAINKLYKSLKCPEGYYNPTQLPFNKAKYFNLISIRSTGKTTNILLWAMCLRKWFENTYGRSSGLPALGYIRENLDMIMPKNIRDMYSVIVDCGYVEKLTDGKYNSIRYENRCFWYVKLDENGDVVEKDNEYITFCFALNKIADYKSTFNNNKMDIVCWDEYISKNRVQNIFDDFLDLIKTIFRDRISPIIFMLSNNLDKRSDVFKDMLIYNDIKFMDFGDAKLIKTEGGTNVYLEIIGLDPKKRKVKERVNRMFYAFNSPRIASITGSMTWNMESFQKIPKDIDDFSELLGNRYIFYRDEILRLRIGTTEKYGTMVLVTPATQTYDDSVIYTVSDLLDKRYRFGLGYSKLDKIFYTTYKRNQWYYAHNDAGNLADHFLQLASKRFN